MKNSEDIFVFPCVSRDTGNSNSDLSAKLMSEQNVTNIIKSITDRKSYIISWVDTTLKCVIDGYYFEINNITKSGDMYAFLDFKAPSNYKLLEGDVLDEDTKKFGGLIIRNTIPTGVDYLTLCENGDDSRDMLSSMGIQ